MQYCKAIIVALFIVIFTQTSMASAGQVRTYYIAAEDVEWDYAPAGKNLITGEPFNEEEAHNAVASDYRLGSKVKKALYFEYTDETFTTRKERPADWDHLGWLGPLIRAEVGDTIRVVFKNNAGFPASVHPHGVFYEKDSEGAPYQDNTQGQNKADDIVAPGGSHIYEWAVPKRAGPTPKGSSTAFWMYHSHTDEVRDFNTGLVGAMIITAKGRAADESLRPKDVDREFIVAFFTTEEASSWYIEHNVRTYMGKPDEIIFGRDPFGGRAVITPVPPPTLEHKDNLNGLIYGNLPMMSMNKGERVRWYLMAGSGFEVHAPHWHGNTGIENNMRVDTIGLVTMGMTQVDMTPDAPGIWLFHCHVTNHMEGGMIARYEVLP